MGLCRGPFPIAPQGADAACPPCSISQHLQAVPVTSQHPRGWVTCQPPAGDTGRGRLVRGQAATLLKGSC